MEIDVISSINNDRGVFERKLISLKEHSKSIEFVHTFDMAVPNNAAFVETKEVADIIEKCGYERPQYYYDTNHIDNMWVKVYITHLLIRRKIKLGSAIYSKAYRYYGENDTLTPSLELYRNKKCSFIYVTKFMDELGKTQNEGFVGKDGYVLVKLENPIVVKNNRTVFKTIDAGDDRDDWFYDEENEEYRRCLKLYLSIKNKALNDTSKQIKFSIRSNRDSIFHVFGYTKGSIRKNNNAYQHKVGELMKEFREKFINITDSTAKKDIQDNANNLALYNKIATFLNIDKDFLDKD